MNNGKLIGFDLDGVLSQTDSLAFRHIDLCEDPVERQFQSEIFHRQIKPIFEVKTIMHEDDTGIVITARDGNDPLLAPITKRWVKKYFPEFELVFVGADSRLKDAGKWKEWQEDIVERKAHIIRERGIYIYFDDSPSIVEGLRSRGIVCLQFGGRI